MFKKTLKFQDFNGNPVEKDFYFHWSKAELVAMMGEDGIQEKIQKIVASKNAALIFEEFGKIVRSACGVRSEDGQTFDKSPRAQALLMDSPAFDALLMELMTNADAASDFIKQLIPEKMQKELKAQLEGIKPSETVDPFAETEDKRPPWEREQRHPTNAELQAMSQDELRYAFAKRAQLDPGPKPE